MLHDTRRTVSVAFVLAVAVGLVVGGVAFASPTALSVGADDRSSLAQEQDAHLRVVHASPGAGPVDVYLNNDTLATNLSFGNASGYLDVSPGDSNVTVTAAGDRNAVVFEGGVSLDPGTAYTVAVTGEVSDGVTDADVNVTETNVTDGNVTDGNVTDGNITDTNVTDTNVTGVNVTDTDVTDTDETGIDTTGAATGVEPVVLVDNATEPGLNNSSVRLVHLSPDAPAVTVTNAETGEVLFENVGYRNASDYVTVPAGNYTLEIRQATADDGAIADNVTGDNVTVDNVTEDNVTTDDVTADNLTADNATDGNLTGDDVTVGDNATVGNATGDNVTAGDDSVIATVDVTLEAESAYSAFAIGSLDAAAENESFQVFVAEDWVVETPGVNETVAVNETAGVNETVGDGIADNETDNVTADNVTANETTDATVGDDTDDETVDNETAGNETTGNETAVVAPADRAVAAWRSR